MTVPHDILAKAMKMTGMDLKELSLDTVKMFAADAKAAGFRCHCSLWTEGAGVSSGKCGGEARQSANMDSGESLRQSSFGLPVGCGATYLPAVGVGHKACF